MFLVSRFWLWIMSCVQVRGAISANGCSCFLIFFSFLVLIIAVVGNYLEAMSDEEREEKELDLSSPEVVTKYKSAAEIVNS